LNSYGYKAKVMDYLFLIDDDLRSCMAETSDVPIRKGYS